MGDEVRRTQRGNNNAYCLDNEVSWFDWTLPAKHADVHRFVKLLNAQRLLRDMEHERQRMSLTQLIQQAAKAWHGVKLNQPDWSPDSHSIAVTVELKRDGLLVHFILNAYWEPLEFELPLRQGEPWRRWIDTALDSPQDIASWQKAAVVVGSVYRAEARSVVVLFATVEAGAGRVV